VLISTVSPKGAGFRLDLWVAISSDVLADLWIGAGLRLAVVAFATTDQCRKHRVQREWSLAAAEFCVKAIALIL
jgi:hypothetical protein